MIEVNQICPICEEINSIKSITCKSCQQDLRSVPLQEYAAFIKSSPSIQKRDLIFNFGTLKHKIKLSFDVLKYLIENEKYDKIPHIYRYFMQQMERERSSLSYYLLLYSRKVFFPYYGLLLIDCHIYFTLQRTYLMQVNLPVQTTIRTFFEVGIEILEDHRDRLIALIDEITEEIEKVDEKEVTSYSWKSPPPPPTPATMMEVETWRKAREE